MLPRNDQDSSTLSVSAFARKWHVGEDKIRKWIESGELRAYNLSSSPLGRPRDRIPVEAEQEFLRRRQSGPTRTPARKRRQPGTDYFP
jgi:hypothetical protein